VVVVVVVGGVVVVVVVGGGGGGGGCWVVVVGRGLVVLGRGRVVVVVVVGATVVVVVSVVVVAVGMSVGIGNGSRLVSTTGEVSDIGTSPEAQPRTPSAMAAAPTASAPVRVNRTCNDPAPLSGTSWKRSAIARTLAGDDRTSEQGVQTQGCQRPRRCAETPGGYH
jgi:hypothetical protein